jgi:hypothetical protein
MSLIGAAGKCGISTSNLVDLLNGRGSVPVAASLHVTTTSLQTFINGGNSLALAAEMGITSASLQELRTKLGPQGAAGLIIGLMWARAR